MKHIARAGAVAAFIFVTAFSAAPALVLTAAAAATPPEIGSGDPTKQTDTTSKADPKNFQIVSCDGVDDPRTAKKEVECDYYQLVKTVERFIRFILWAVTPVLVGMMVYTGFEYMTAGGDANLIARAKSMVVPILIGCFFIFAGWLLVFTVLDKLLDDNVAGIKKSDVIAPVSSNPINP